MKLDRASKYIRLGIAMRAALWLIGYLWYIALIFCITVVLMLFTCTSIMMNPGVLFVGVLVTTWVVLTVIIYKNLA